MPIDTRWFTRLVPKPTLLLFVRVHAKKSIIISTIEIFPTLLILIF